MSEALSGPWTDELPDLVGPVEIAERLEVMVGTVHSWRYLRKATRMPEPDYILSGHPIWIWARIELWAQQSGRLP